jgi:hypothetical protein
MRCAKPPASPLVIATQAVVRGQGHDAVLTKVCHLYKEIPGVKRIPGYLSILQFVVIISQKWGFAVGLVVFAFHTPRIYRPGPELRFSVGVSDVAAPDYLDGTFGPIGDSCHGQP